MASDDKKKQAMSLLFGDAPAKPRGVEPREAEPRSKPSAGPSADPEEAEEAPAVDDERGADAGVEEKRRPSERVRAKRSRREGGASGENRGEENEHRDPYYEGQGRYRRKDGVRVKKSVYLDPDVWRAVSVAAAVGDDPRGANASEIINTLLREAGYEG
jgi:hypothetical protein